MQQNNGVIKMSICCSYLVWKNATIVLQKVLTFDIRSAPGVAIQTFLSLFLHDLVQTRLKLGMHSKKPSLKIYKVKTFNIVFDNFW